jgi:hypothetical protein
MFGVNERMNPEVGDALSIMNDPTEREPVAGRIRSGENLSELWNHHFAGVIMKDSVGDFVTLDNAADETHEKFNAQWILEMYGTRVEAQTFHGALKAGSHGPGIRASPLTMAFTAGQAPNPVVEFPANNSVITSKTYTINVDPRGATNNVRVKIDGGDWQQTRRAVGRYWYDWSGYDEGPHTIEVEAWNLAGQRVVAKTVRVRYEPAEEST